ncbi:spondin domain-containing protein [Roseateles sp. NT4]|uniref:spondin domain-containing protein n=1 Tax=Roseateles sp. NT4 TaxID=3453715 RepID=UPI003EECC7DE
MSMAPEPDAVTYRATLSTDWATSNFPTWFPANRHFSGLVGAVHDASVSFWRDGGLATQGIQDMAERGQKAALLAEVAQAQQAGAVSAALSGAGIGTAETQVSIEFVLTQRHPLLTLVSMVAPSPDWFVGVAGLPLQKDGRWVTRLSLALEVHDAGTDSGLSFASPDLASNPHGPIRLLSSAVADTDLDAGLHRVTRAPLASLLLERLG